jgi:hypothetical protein
MNDNKLLLSKVVSPEWERILLGFMIAIQFLISDIVLGFVMVACWVIQKFFRVHFYSR